MSEIKEDISLWFKRSIGNNAVTVERDHLGWFRIYEYRNRERFFGPREEKVLMSFTPEDVRHLIAILERLIK